MQSSDHRVQLNILVAGFVKRYLINNDGELSVQSIFGPGYVFPLTPVFMNLLGQSLYSGPETIYYEAMQDAEVFSISLETLKEKIEADPTLYKELFAEAGIRLEDNIQRLENLSLKTSYKRLAHQLVFFASKFEENEKTGRKILIPLTHQDLADILSLTRETVSTAMVELRKKNLIQTGKYISVPSLAKLKEEAYS